MNRILSSRLGSNDSATIPEGSNMASATITGSAKPPEPNRALSEEELRKMQAYWRAANYLSVGQIYLYANPLLEMPLRLEHVKPRLLGHWGTTGGLNFLYVHLNRLIKDNDLNMIYVIGPGHGGPGIVAHSYLEAHTPSIIPRSSAAGTACNGCFD